MQTVGLVGVGKIGLAIAENLIKSGYQVVGYRRSPMPEFEKLGGVRRSPAEVGEQADIVLTCLPSSEALDEVIQGANGLVRGAARAGRGRTRLASGSAQAGPDRAARRQGRGLHRRRGQRHAGHGAARKAVIYLGGDADACKKPSR